MIPPHTPDFSKLIGIPYEQMNCWGIVKEFYRIVFNIELNSYCERSDITHPEAEKLITSNKGEFKLVPAPKFGDILLIKLHGLECHIGVYLDSGKFLHTSRGNGCMIDRMERWRHLICGAYRVSNA